MNKKINFKVMAKGYGKAFKEVREFINKLIKENERLKEDIEWWKDRFFGQQVYDDSYRIIAIEYRKSIYKAIEYVENFEYYIPEDNKEELIKILKGEDNE